MWQPAAAFSAARSLSHSPACGRGPDPSGARNPPRCAMPASVRSTLSSSRVASFVSPVSFANPASVTLVCSRSSDSRIASFAIVVHAGVRHLRVTDRLSRLSCARPAIAFSPASLKRPKFMCSSSSCGQLAHDRQTRIVHVGAGQIEMGQLAERREMRDPLVGDVGIAQRQLLRPVSLPDAPSLRRAAACC